MTFVVFPENYFEETAILSKKHFEKTAIMFIFAVKLTL